MVVEKATLTKNGEALVRFIEKKTAKRIDLHGIISFDYLLISLLGVHYLNAMSFVFSKSCRNFRVCSGWVGLYSAETALIMS